LRAEQLRAAETPEWLTVEEAARVLRIGRTKVCGPPILGPSRVRV
jgi:hypothetical protein